MEILPRFSKAGWAQELGERLCSVSDAGRASERRDKEAKKEIIYAPKQSFQILDKYPLAHAIFKML
jgi:hypothetical protein